jgi:hypothetical protein
MVPRKKVMNQKKDAAEQHPSSIQQAQVIQTKK